MLYRILTIYMIVAVVLTCQANSKTLGDKLQATLTERAAGNCEECDPCEDDEFTCDDGGCMPSHARCDGVPQCMDFSDEANCAAGNCEDDEFACNDGGVCIPTSYLCDAIPQCNDASDEENCDGGGDGDPHMETFDGKKYDFQGYCTYVLMRDSCQHQDKPTFQIAADFRGRMNPTKPPTRMVAINISAAGIPAIRLLEDNTFMIEGKLQYGTEAVFDMGTVTTEGETVVVRINEPDLSITWNGKPHKVRITLHDMTMSGNVCGLLGNADRDSENDFIKPDGNMAFSTDEFGNSWAVPGSCP